MPGKMPHTACHPGKRVRVKLHSGEVIFDRFVTRTDRYIVLEERGKVMKRDIDSFGPVRNPEGTEPGGAP
ncbi:MAG: hypothetical protein JXA87_06785 [Thermoleophilia bacterium]|nr:hypothetical protein [Thermoleophilia bacterium]